LNPKWKIISPDKNRWTLADNEYFLIITAKKGTNVLQFNGELPTDYEVIVKVHTPPQYNGQVVRLLLLKDDGNDVHIGYYALLQGRSEYRDSEVYFAKTLRGESSPIYKKVDRLSQDARLYLKLIKRGIDYTGAYSTDGLTWFHIGTHVFLDLDGKPAIEAYNSPVHIYSEKPPESGIRFDYVEIRKLNQ
jgi:hypothetical protein